MCGKVDRNHDIVYAGRERRSPGLATATTRDPGMRAAEPRRHGPGSDSPGIRMLFMGQEIPADRPWSDTPSPDTSIDWAALDRGDKIVVDYLRFARN